MIHLMGRKYHEVSIGSAINLNLHWISVWNDTGVVAFKASSAKFILKYQHTQRQWYTASPETKTYKANSPVERQCCLNLNPEKQNQKINLVMFIPRKQTNRKCCSEKR